MGVLTGRQPPDVRPTVASPARSPVPVLAGWVLTRGLLVALEVAGTQGVRQSLDGDSRLYRLWVHQLLTGVFPSHDPRWQYPPGAVPVLLLPHLLAAHYRTGLLVVMLAADLIVELALLRRVRRGHSPAAAWYWTVAMAAVGPLLYLRFDLVPAALVVLAVLAEAAPALSTALLTAGALIKVWPLALLGLPLRLVRARGRALAALAAVCVLLAAGLAARGFLAASVRSFLAHQSGRGLQVESLAALPVMVAGAIRGRPPVTVYRDGAYQLVGFGGVGHVCSLLAPAVLLLTTLLGARAAWRGLGVGEVLDLCLGGIVLTVLVAEVLSPQYLIWLVATAAAALVHSRRQLPAAIAIGVACPLTAALFPYLYGGFLGAQPLPVTIAGLRDVALLTALGLAWANAPWALLRARSGRGGPSSTAEGSH